MARINVEKKWWGDPRRGTLIELTGSAHKADGMALSAWHLAQQYFFPKKLAIPFSDWEKFGFGMELIKAQLAILIDDGRNVWVKGSGEHFGWLFQRSNAGKASVKARKQAKQRPSDGRLTVVKRLSSSLLSTPHSSISSPSSRKNVDKSGNQKTKKKSAGKGGLDTAYKGGSDDDVAQAQKKLIRARLQRGIRIDGTEGNA